MSAEDGVTNGANGTITEDAASVEASMEDATQATDATAQQPDAPPVEQPTTSETTTGMLC